MALRRVKCAWCGEPVRGMTRCKRCAALRRDYLWYCKNIHKGSDQRMLLAFRNMLLDFKYNMSNATLMPYDVDYQLDRVNSYLNKEVD